MRFQRHEDRPGYLAGATGRSFARSVYRGTSASSTGSRSPWPPPDSREMVGSNLEDLRGVHQPVDLVEHQNLAGFAQVQLALSGFISRWISSSTTTLPVRSRKKSFGSSRAWWTRGSSQSKYAAPSRDWHRTVFPGTPDTLEPEDVAMVQEGIDPVFPEAALEYADRLAFGRAKR